MNSVYFLNIRISGGINEIRDIACNLTRHVSTDSYRVLVINSADRMTIDAQLALKKIMEQDSKYTRFFFICSLKSKLIPALYSRCVKLACKKITEKNIIDRLREIAKKEFSDDSNLNNSINKIAKSCGGNLRFAINLLQIYLLSGCDLDYLIYGGDPLKLNKLTKINDLFSYLNEKSFMLNNLFISRFVFEEIINNDSIEEEKKLKIVTRFLIIMSNIKNKGDPLIQSFCFFDNVKKIINGENVKCMGLFI